jgi:hypothetical protein
MKAKKMTCFRLRAVSVALLKALAAQADVTQTRWIEDEIEQIAVDRLGAEQVQAIKDSQNDTA